MTNKRGRKPLERWQVEDAARLRALFETNAGMSQEKFGQAYGIGSQGAVWQYLEGRIPLNLEVALKFAEGLKVEVSAFSPQLGRLLGAARAESPKSHYNVTQDADSVGKVPVISWVNAGQWSTVVDNFHPGDADEWAKTTVPIRQHTYALRVRGDSMTNPAGDPTFPDGSVIVVEPEAIGDLARMVNQYVIVKRATDDEVTFKQLVKDAGRYYLKPLNPRYPIIELREDDTFCGVVRERVVRFF